MDYFYLDFYFYYLACCILLVLTLREPKGCNYVKTKNVMLPPLFEMEDYESCIKEGNLYCKVDAVLKVPFYNTNVQREINEYVSNHDTFDRSVIHRAICLPTKFLSSNESIEKQLSKLVNLKIGSYNVTAEVDHHVCSSRDIPVTLFDNIYLYSYAAYIVLVLFATFYELVTKTSPKDNGSILQNFSLLRSWKSRTSVSKNEDFNKLLSMQGIRFFTMIFIIYVHTGLSYFLIYLKSPDLLEKLMVETKFISVFGVFTVFPFFLISSWLLTLQAYNIYEKHGQFTLKHVGIILVNRYLRFITAVTIIYFAVSNWILKMGGPVNFDIFYMSQKACNRNWWYNIFYLNNFLIMFNMCNPVSWYLAADFQLYVINILVIYTILKFKLSEYKAYGIFFLICFILHATMLYYYNSNVIFLPNARNLERRYFYWSLDFMVSYSSTLSNASCSCIGMILGVIYFKYKRRIINFNQIHSIIWAMLFLGLPALTVKLSMKEYGHWDAAVLGALVKPMYTLGIGIGILGMSYNLGGIFKKVFENKYAVLFSNFSFSIYITHMSFPLVRHSYELPAVDYFVVIQDYIFVIPVSFAFGILITLLIEEPLLSIQKKMVPQIKKYDDAENKTN